MSKKLTKITTSELILSAIFYLQQKNGVTAKEITKYICEKRGCAQKHMKENVKKALERATGRGIFRRNRGFYRINHDFGLNKIVNNKIRGKGKKGNKATKFKEIEVKAKTDFPVTLRIEKGDGTMPVCQIVEERMNNVSNHRDSYVELPATKNQDDDEDDDFEDTEDDDDDDENDFFSDDTEEKGNNNEPRTIYFNENINSSFHRIDSTDYSGLRDPFRRGSADRCAENESFGRGLKGKEDEDMEDKDKEDSEEESHDDEIMEHGSDQKSETFKESSENPSETVQSVDEMQSGDEDHKMEVFNNQLQVEMDWDSQPKDLERMDRLLKTENYAMKVESNTALENTNMLEENTLKVELSMEDDPTEGSEASPMHEST